MRAVRLDDRSPQPDLPWADLFQSELDSWTPTRLPAHFRPRPETLTRRTGPLGSWRRAGLGAAVAALVAALLLPASSPLPDVVRLLTAQRPLATAVPGLAPAGRTTTRPTADAVPGTPAGGPAAPSRDGQTAPRVSPAPSTSPAPSQSGGAVLGGLLPPIVNVATPTAAPAAAPSPTPSAGGASAPSPTPSPSRRCVLGLLCL